MIRLRRLAGGLLFIMVIMLGGLRLIRPTHHDAVAALFTNPDGSACQRPCLFGLRPGETTRVQAIQLLKAHPLTGNLAPETTALFKMSSRGSTPMTVSFDTTSDGLVDWVSLYAPASPLHPSPKLVDTLAEPIALGDIIAEAGQPDKLGTFYGYTYLYFYTARLVVAFPDQPSGIVSTTARADYMATSAVITDLVLFNLRDCPQGSALDFFKPWLGFASERRYAQATEIETPTRPIAGPHTIWLLCRR